MGLCYLECSWDYSGEEEEQRFGGQELNYRWDLIAEEGDVLSDYDSWNHREIDLKLD